MSGGRPALVVEVALEEAPRVYLCSDSYEDARRLLLSLQGGGLDELRETVELLAIYVEERAG